MYCDVPLRTVDVPLCTIDLYRYVPLRSIGSRLKFQVKSRVKRQNQV